VIGLSPPEFEWMCPADLSAIAEGYMLMHRDRWERAILHANSTGMLKKPLAYSDLFGNEATKNTIKSKEEWEEFKRRFKRLRKEDG